MSNSYFQYIENALVMLEEKITRLGTGYTNFWYISAAFGLVLSKASPGNAATQKQQAIDRVARQYYKVLASQEDIFSAKERMLLHRPTKVSYVRRTTRSVRITCCYANTLTPVKCGRNPDTILRPRSSNSEP